MIMKDYVQNAALMWAHAMNGVAVDLAERLI